MARCHSWAPGGATALTLTMSHMRESLLTAEQLAGRWQVPKSHVYRLTREGTIPAVKLGRYYRYRLDAIERWEIGELEPNPAHVAVA